MGVLFHCFSPLHKQSIFAKFCKSFHAREVMNCIYVIKHLKSLNRYTGLSVLDVLLTIHGIAHSVKNLVLGKYRNILCVVGLSWVSQRARWCALRLGEKWRRTWWVWLYQQKRFNSCPFCLSLSCRGGLWSSWNATLRGDEWREVYLWLHGTLFLLRRPPAHGRVIAQLSAERPLEWPAASLLR